MVKKELKIRKIENGTVIDHIKPGMALYVLDILKITGHKDTISLAMNVHSNKMGTKDIIKIENYEVKPEDYNKIALISDATINIIKNFKVVKEKKKKVEIPNKLEDIIRCINPECITNAREPVKRTFSVVEKDPLSVQCSYCNKTMDKKDCLKSLLRY